MRNLIAILTAAAMVFTLAAGALGQDNVEQEPLYDTPELPYPDLPADHPDNDTGFVPEIGPEHVSVAEAEGIDPQSAKRLMGLQAERVEQLDRALENVPEGVVLQVELPPFQQTDTKPAKVKVHGAEDHGKVVSALAKVGVPGSVATVAKVNAAEKARILAPSETVGENHGYQECNNDGWIEGGRMIVLRNTSRPFDDEGTYHSCNDDTPFGQCSTGFSVEDNSNPSIDGVLTAGHCVENNGYWCNAWYRSSSGRDYSYGSELWDTRLDRIAYSMTVRHKWKYGCNNDFAMMRERYENAKVRPKVYMRDGIWRTVYGMQHYKFERPAVNMKVCIRASYSRNLHGTSRSVFCGDVVDSNHGTIYHNDAYFFKIEWDDTKPISGDSGSPIYILRNDGRISAIGLYVLKDHGFGVAQKIGRVTAVGKLTLMRTGCNCGSD